MNGYVCGRGNVNQGRRVEAGSLIRRVNMWSPATCLSRKNQGGGGSRSKKRETEFHSFTLLFEIHLKNWISPAKRNTHCYITFRAYLGTLTIIQKVYFQTAEQYEAEYKNASRVTALKHNITNHPYSRCLWFSFIRCQFVSLEVCRSAFWWLAHIFFVIFEKF